MFAALMVGFLATLVALLGVLGRAPDSRPWPSQVVALALPIAIIAPGLAAGGGMTLTWAIVAVISVFLAVSLGAVLGNPVALRHTESHPAAAGLSLGISGIIAIGLAIIVAEWGGNLIKSFILFDNTILTLVLVAAAVAYAIGGHAIVGLSRVVLVLVIIGAVAIFAAGFVVGDFGTLGSPLVAVPSISPGAGILYAIGVVAIGAGFPVLRQASHNNSRAGIVAAIILALVTAVFLLGMLAIYGGAFQVPSLVINTFPFFLPSYVSAVIAGLVALVAVIVAGTCIRAASDCAAAVVPRWYSDVEAHPGPRRWVGLAIGVAVLVGAELAPPPATVVALLGLLGVANIVVERWMARQPQPEPVEASTSHS